MEVLDVGCEIGVVVSILYDLLSVIILLLLLLLLPLLIMVLLLLLFVPGPGLSLSQILLINSIIFILGGTGWHIIPTEPRPTITHTANILLIIILTIGRIRKTIQPTTPPKLNNSMHSINIHIYLINPTIQQQHLPNQFLLHIVNILEKMLELLEYVLVYYGCRCIGCIGCDECGRDGGVGIGYMGLAVHLGDMMMFVEGVEELSVGD